MDERGYIKIWRKLQDSEVFADPHLWHLFSYLLIRANHTKQAIPVKTGRGTTTVTLKPGQLLFGRKSAAERLQTPASSIRNRVRRLEAINCIEIKPDTHFSIVTICNWGLYQQTNSKGGQARDTQRTPKGHPKDTEKNDNNDKNDKKEEGRASAGSKFKKPSRDELAAYIAEADLVVDPDAFLDYYESNGWRVSRAPMKDWKATCRGWSRRELNNNPDAASQNAGPIKQAPTDMLSLGAKS